jgi:RHS repeat-associated protein
MTALGYYSNTNAMQLVYDSSGRTVIARQDSGGMVGVQYFRDANDRIVTRMASGSTEGNSNEYFGYTNDSDNPSYLLNSSDALQERYLDLPGGVELTVRSGTTRVYSLPDVQGNVMATADQSGSSVVGFRNDPFGQPIGTAPGNVSVNASYAAHGNSQILTEGAFASAIMDTGARTYIPAIGRLTSVDSVENGNANAYMYPADPVNGQDLTGKCYDQFAELYPVCSAIYYFLVNNLETINAGLSGVSSDSAAANLEQQLALKEAESFAPEAEHLDNVILNDHRYHANFGRVKLQYKKELSNGRYISIHYLYNTITGKSADYKIKFVKNL